MSNFLRRLAADSNSSSEKKETDAICDKLIRIWNDLDYKLTKLQAKSFINNTTIDIDEFESIFPKIQEIIDYINQYNMQTNFPNVYEALRKQITKALQDGDIQFINKFRNYAHHEINNKDEAELSLNIQNLVRFIKGNQYLNKYFTQEQENKIKQLEKMGISSGMIIDYLSQNIIPIFQDFGTNVDTDISQEIRNKLTEFINVIINDVCQVADIKEWAECISKHKLDDLQDEAKEYRKAIEEKEKKPTIEKVESFRNRVVQQLAGILSDNGNHFKEIINKLLDKYKNSDINHDTIMSKCRMLSASLRSLLTIYNQINKLNNIKNIIAKSSFTKLSLNNINNNTKGANIICNFTNLVDELLRTFSLDEIKDKVKVLTQKLENKSDDELIKMVQDMISSSTSTTKNDNMDIALLNQYFKQAGDTETISGRLNRLKVSKQSFDAIFNGLKKFYENRIKYDIFLKQYTPSGKEIGSLTLDNLKKIIHNYLFSNNSNKFRTDDKNHPQAINKWLEGQIKNSQLQFSDINKMQAIDDELQDLIKAIPDDLRSFFLSTILPLKNVELTNSEGEKFNYTKFIEQCRAAVKMRSGINRTNKLNKIFEEFNTKFNAALNEYSKNMEEQQAADAREQYMEQLNLSSEAKEFIKKYSVKEYLDIRGTINVWIITMKDNDAAIQVYARPEIKPIDAANFIIDLVKSKNNEIIKYRLPSSSELKPGMPDYIASLHVTYADETSMNNFLQRVEQTARERQYYTGIDVVNHFKNIVLRMSKDGTISTNNFYRKNFKDDSDLIPDKQQREYNDDNAAFNASRAMLPNQNDSSKSKSNFEFDSISPGNSPTFYEGPAKEWHAPKGKDDTGTWKSVPSSGGNPILQRNFEYFTNQLTNNASSNSRMRIKNGLLRRILNI